MGEVTRFPTRLRPITPIGAEQIAIRDALILTMSGTCRHCGGSGLKVEPKNLRMTHIDDWDIRPCPCGGDDENRIGCDEPDFDGAA